MNKIFCPLLFLITLSAYVCLGQDKIQTTEPNWTRIESTSKDFSIAVPSDYIVDIEDDTYRIYFYKGEVQMSVSIKEEKNAKKDFKRRFSYIKNQAENHEFFTGNDFVGVQYNGKYDSSESFYKSLDLASSNGIYFVTVSSKNLTGNDYTKFLYSLRLNEKPFFVQNIEFLTNEQKISVSSLKIDEIVVKALQKEDSKQIKLEKATDEEKEKINDTTNYSRQLITLRRPRAPATLIQQGNVKLKEQ